MESVINTRPLIYVGDDIESTITLTPSSFLTLNPNTGMPTLDYDKHDQDYNPYESSAERLLQIWKKGQKLLNSFWQVWRNEYLLSLRERTQTHLKTKKLKSHISPSVGDIVLIKDDIPRGCWRLGKVTHLASSFDGCIRSAEVQLSSGKVLRRPLNLLFPTETSKGDKSATSDKDIPTEQNEGKSSRLKRAAAVRANEKIKQCLNN